MVKIGCENAECGIKSDVVVCVCESELESIWRSDGV